MDEQHTPRQPELDDNPDWAAILNETKPAKHGSQDSPVHCEPVLTMDEQAQQFEPWPSDEDIEHILSLFMEESKTKYFYVK